MAKVQGPLLSLGGTGQIGHSQVYATWKGRPYARRYVIPANPQSTEQTKTRTVFSLLNDMYRLANSAFQAPWKAFVQGKVQTDRNAFFGRNIKVLRPKGFPELATLVGMLFSPGAKGGLVADITWTTTGGNLVATAPAPDPLPAGWVVTGFTLAAVLDQDPQAGGSPEIQVAQAPTPTGTDPWVATLTAIGAGVYAATGWFTFQRSTAVTDLAYGPAEAVQQTVTA